MRDAAQNHRFRKSSFQTQLQLVAAFTHSGQTISFRLENIADEGGNGVQRSQLLVLPKVRPLAWSLGERVARRLQKSCSRHPGEND
jgi:hypothetical protein